ncbi:hypothetical protein ACTFIU_005879 [Dictyostelium citrinum]
MSTQVCFLKLWRNIYIKNQILYHLENQKSFSNDNNLAYIVNRKKFSDINSFGFLVKRKLWSILILMIEKDEYLVVSESSLKKFFKTCKDLELIRLILKKMRIEIENLLNIYPFLVGKKLVNILELVDKEFKQSYKPCPSFILDCAIRSGSIEIIEYIYNNITKSYDKELVIFSCFHFNNQSPLETFLY